MPNLFTGTVEAQPPTQIDVDTVSKTIIVDTPTRTGLVLTNLSDGTIYIAFGANPAVLNSGIAVLPGGGNFSMDEFVYSKEIVSAIAHTNNSLLAIQEFVVRA